MHRQVYYTYDTSKQSFICCLLGKQLTHRGFAAPSPGSICCRFRNSSDELKALGTFLRAQLKGGFEPYFLIEEDPTRWPAQQVLLDEPTVEDMRVRGYFDLDRVRVRAARENAPTRISIGLQTSAYPSGVTVLPISGFPRQLMSEDGAPTGTETPPVPPVSDPSPLSPVSSP